MQHAQIARLCINKMATSIQPMRRGCVQTTITNSTTEKSRPPSSSASVSATARIPRSSDLPAAFGAPSARGVWVEHRADLREGPPPRRRPSLVVTPTSSVVVVVRGARPFVVVEHEAEHFLRLHQVQRLFEQAARRRVGADDEEKAVHPFADDPRVRNRDEGRRRSTSIRSTRASAACARAPARLIAVVVLPSPTVALETARTERADVRWACSTRCRRPRYCSASYEWGATRLTRRSSRVAMRCRLIGGLRSHPVRAAPPASRSLFPPDASLRRRGARPGRRGPWPAGTAAAGARYPGRWRCRRCPRGPGSS